MPVRRWGPSEYEADALTFREWQYAQWLLELWMTYEYEFAEPGLEADIGYRIVHLGEGVEDNLYEVDVRTAEPLTTDQVDFLMALRDNVILMHRVESDPARPEQASFAHPLTYVYDAAKFARLATMLCDEEESWMEIVDAIMQDPAEADD